MSHDNTSPDDAARQRIVNLEEQLAFQQRTIDHLSDVLHTLQNRTDQCERALQKLQSEVASVQERQSEDLPHEKPPHY